MEKSKEKSIEVQLRLMKVLETSYFFDSAVLSSISDFDITKMSIGFAFKFDVFDKTDEFVLHLLTKFLYPINNEPTKILELNTANHFGINKLTELIEVNENKQMKDKAGILPTLLGVSIGTLRGILVVKTLGTILADHPLPIINPTELLNPKNIQPK